MRFISGHKSRFGVEPICRVLTEHGCPIAPSSYYDAAGRPPSPRARRDEQLKAAITRVPVWSLEIGCGLSMVCFAGGRGELR